MSLSIVGLGTSNPQHTMTQRQAAQLAVDACQLDNRQQRLSGVLHRRSGVHVRQTVVPHKVAMTWVNGDSNGSASEPSRGPTTRERMELYEEHVAPMAATAVREALHVSELEPADITHLITVSCTGFSAPGLDVALIEQFQLAPSTQRLHVGYMGCHGAINGLRAAQAFVEANPNACILLCAAECCSLHYRFQWDPDRFIGNALFGDGAAAVIGCGTEHPASRNTIARLTDTGSCLIPDSTSAIKWDVGDHGFEMYLSPRAPELIEQHLREWMTEWLADHQLRIQDIRSWAIHPGGPRILCAVESALELTSEDLAVSREVLAEHGNMSSPTILFILNRLRQREAAWPCVAVGFGPGMFAEAALYDA